MPNAQPTTQRFGGFDWIMTGRGLAAEKARPPNVTALVEEVPEETEYRWYLERTNHPPKYFSDLANAHAYISGHKIALDFIEPFDGS